MANALNDFFFFNKIGRRLDKEIPRAKLIRDRTFYLISRESISFLISPTNPKEITDIVTNLDDSKSPGPCCIPTKLLKLVRNETRQPFSAMPCHKSGSTKDINN